MLLSKNPNFLNAIDLVRAEIQNNPEKVKEADEVISKYGRLFHPDNLQNLSAEEFKGFLNFKNNRHWTSIHRQGSSLTSNMDRLRKALKILLDESQPLEGRLKILRPVNGTPFIKGLARSVITPILHVVYPVKYGVLNNVAEQGLQLAELYPKLNPKSDFAEQYIAINKILNQISQEFSLKLWFVDWIWWKIQDNKVPAETEILDQSNLEAVFGLERYLHEFLLDNWQNLDLSKEWQLWEKDGEIIGSEYRTDVGRIDLLAHHNDQPEWLVIELKRDQAFDRTVGQILRYMGWVHKNLCASDETVKGLIIAKESDDSLNYALTQVKNVTVKTYKIHFDLIDDKKLAVAQN